MFWGLLEGAVAAVLLVAGGLRALQLASITMALPFSIVLVMMCFGLVKCLRLEVPIKPKPRTARLEE
ncbi:MAG: BCCT family transporter [Myxococcota bacterium]